MPAEQKRHDVAWEKAREKAREEASEDPLPWYWIVGMLAAVMFILALLV
jgi:hypothetical protein